MKIGITEAGDASRDLSWVNKLDKVDAVIAITKNVTPEFMEAALQNKDKIIVHATCTGYGGTAVEPNVPEWHIQLGNVYDLIKAGFPANQVVLRVDPIIPTPKGLKRAQQILLSGVHLGVSRMRVSVLDMYPHVRKRFEAAKMQLPYGNAFQASNEQMEAVNALLAEVKAYAKEQGRDIEIEACAERLSEAKAVGCISVTDLDVLEIAHKEEDAQQCGFQRSGCLCMKGKTELLTHKYRCQNQCLYCYWRDQTSKN